MPPDTERPAPIPTEDSMLPVLRALTECHLQINRTSARAFEAMGLTQAQFDVVVTLGDTAGMTCKELGEKTFITKGTLTPVLDRLESKGLIVRAKGQRDTREKHVSLTPEGQRAYERHFMGFVDAMRARFDVLEPNEQDFLIALLKKLKAGFD
jgi:DNA-binding MarR family transcriptional regulator